MEKKPLGRGFEHLTPNLARNARKALSRTHKQIADEIGERPATVMRYELGKPVDDIVSAKLRHYFEACQIVAIGDTVTRYEVYRSSRPDEGDV